MDIQNLHNLDLSSKIESKLTPIIQLLIDDEFYSYNKKWSENSQSIRFHKSFFRSSEDIKLLLKTTQDLQFCGISRLALSKQALFKIYTESDKIINLLMEIKAFWEDEKSLPPINALQERRDDLAGALSSSVAEFISLTEAAFLKKKLEDSEARHKKDAELLIQREIQKLQVSKAIKTFEDKFFAPVARNHEEAATIWMFMGVFYLAISAYVSYGIYDDVNSIFMNYIDKDKTQDVPPFLFAGVLASKFFCLSILVFGNLWVLKNYKINKHNELKNKHRSVTLQTFNHLLDGAGNDQEARRNILNLVGQTLFETKEFGYINKK